MRHTSYARLSSNAAQSFMAFFSSSLTRIVTSQIFFSLIGAQTKKPRRRLVAWPGQKNPAADAGRGEERWIAVILGGLLFWFGWLENIGPEQLEIHQAPFRDTFAPPLRNRL